MAQAPRPGVSRRDEETKAAQAVMALRIKDETRTLAIGSIPLQERLICRRVTGLPVNAFIGQNQFDIDSLQVIWWLAGRAAGDPFLTLDKVVDEWPDDLTPDDFELSVDEPDDGADDPEA